MHVHKVHLNTISTRCRDFRPISVQMYLIAVCAHRLSAKLHDSRTHKVHLNTILTQCRDFHPVSVNLYLICRFRLPQREVDNHRSVYNRSLPDAIHIMPFREHLYYRLNALDFNIPPLRERSEYMTWHRYPLIVSNEPTVLNRDDRSCISSRYFMTVLRDMRMPSAASISAIF